MSAPNQSPRCPQRNILCPFWHLGSGAYEGIGMGGVRGVTLVRDLGWAKPHRQPHLIATISSIPGGGRAIATEPSDCSTSPLSVSPSSNGVLNRAAQQSSSAVRWAGRGCWCRRTPTGSTPPWRRTTSSSRCRSWPGWCCPTSGSTIRCPPPPPQLCCCPAVLQVFFLF